MCGNGKPEGGRVPVSSDGMLTHGRHLEGGSQVHAPVALQLLVSAAEQTRDRARLSAFPEAVHHPYRLPVEVHMTLHREQGVHPPGTLQGAITPSILLLRACCDHTQQEHAPHQKIRSHFANPHIQLDHPRPPNPCLDHISSPPRVQCFRVAGEEERTAIAPTP